jgi:hypothetical protein
MATFLLLHNSFFLRISVRKRYVSQLQGSEFLARDPEASDLFPGATRYSEKHWVKNRVYSASRG